MLVVLQLPAAAAFVVVDVVAAGVPVDQVDGEEGVQRGGRVETVAAVALEVGLRIDFCKKAVTKEEEESDLRLKRLQVPCTCRRSKARARRSAA